MFGTLNLGNLSPGAYTSTKGALWSPLNLGPALYAWFDPSYLPSLTVATGVSQWVSRVGSATATQGTAANQPRWEATGLASRPALTFDGTLQSAVTSTSYPSVPVTLCAIHAVSDISTFRSLFGPSASGGLQLQVRTDGYASIVSGGVVEIGRATKLCTLNAVNLNIATYDGSEWAHYVNGSAAGSGTLVRTLTSTAMQIGIRTASTERFKGPIGDMLVMSTVLSTVNRQKVEGYLAWKYGNANLLPSLHPYRYAPPRV